MAKEHCFFFPVHPLAENLIAKVSYNGNERFCLAKSSFIRKKLFPIKKRRFGNDGFYKQWIERKVKNERV